MQTEVFSTGQVAKICKVAPRTVSKWFDTGKLRGYRIPGGHDRRVPRGELVDFLNANGMPIPAELGGAQAAHARPGVLGLCCQPRLVDELAEQLWGYDVLAYPTGFDLGIACARRPPRALVLDFASGYSECCAIMAFALTISPPPALIALCREDRSDDHDLALAAGACAAITWPAPASAVARAILDHARQEAS